jgi:hypothetical protein
MRKRAHTHLACWLMLALLPLSMKPAGMLFGFVVSVLLAWSVRQAFLKPVFLVMVMTKFHVLVRNQAINLEWDERLSSLSGKFRDLKDKALTPPLALCHGRPDSRTRHNLAMISILLITAALIAGMIGYSGRESYTITIASTPGGSVIAPGEGTFTYYEGTVVRLVAGIEAGYRLADWTIDGGTMPMSMMPRPTSP